MTSFLLLLSSSFPTDLLKSRFQSILLFLGPEAQILPTCFTCSQQSVSSYSLWSLTVLIICRNDLMWKVRESLAGREPLQSSFRPDLVAPCRLQWSTDFLWLTLCMPVVLGHSLLPGHSLNLGADFPSPISGKPFWLSTKGLQPGTPSPRRHQKPSAGRWSPTQGGNLALAWISFLFWKLEIVLSRFLVYAYIKKYYSLRMEAGEWFRRLSIYFLHISAKSKEYGLERLASKNNCPLL